MNLNDNTFLAFKKSVGDSDESPLEVGVVYDVAQEIDEKNHWFEEGEIDPRMLALMMSVAARGMHELFRYCFVGRSLDTAGLQIAIRRFVAVSWLLHSEMLVGADGVPLTLEQLAALPQIDCTKCTMSVLAKNFGKQWAFHARVQKRQGSKVNYRESAKTGWEKRRARIAAEAKAKKRKTK